MIKVIKILAIIFFFIGLPVTFIGSLFKLMHWLGAGTMLTIGMTMEAIGALLFGAFLVLREVKKS